MASLTVKTRDQIRDDILRTVRNALIRRGVANPNVTPGSDYYILATSIANELVVVEANTQIAADDMMPDTAVSTALERLCGIYGIARRPAGGSHGYIVLRSSATASIATGDALIDGAGLSYEVSVGGSYATGTSVPVVATSTGRATNHVAGDLLRWVAPPAYVDTKATVDIGGLTGGVDAEDYETLRSRLIERLRNPPGGGNSSQVAGYAEDSTPRVQKAFVYPAINGPSTQHVVVVGYTSDTNKTRDLDSTTVSSIVGPYVLGQLPEFVETTVTTVQNQPADVAFALALPSATTASPPGPGGGWSDGTPWPQPSGTYCDVTAVTSSTQFAVNASTAPTAGVSQVCWVSPTTWTLYTATVTAVSGTGPYTVTIDSAFPGLTVGCFVSPKADNMQTYVDAAIAAFAALGPGEKSSNPGVLTRGYRHPRPITSWPYKLDTSMTKRITSSSDEVEDTNFLYRSATTPTVPGSVSLAPYIFVPRHLGFYPQ